MGMACPEARDQILPRAVLRLSTGKALAIVTGLGFALRLYLSLTSYCMSGDGMGYLAMAQDFAAGNMRQALDNVFSPLYPALIAIVHLILPDWELAADLVSAVLGTAAIVTVFGMTRVIFERKELALGAAALTAFHPDLAAYAASVRTEAGFMLLTTSAIWLIVSGLKRHRMIYLAPAGAICGLAYLYRTEAIGLAVFTCAFIPLAAILWRQWKFGYGLRAAAIFGLVFLTIAAPYVLFLHARSGHWSIGREFTAAMILGMDGSTPKAAAWKNLGFSPAVSPFAAVFASPRLYLLNSARHLASSGYGFLQALGPVLTVLMLIGLWARRRDLAGKFAEALVGLLILFYVAGFTLSYTGTRFMSHLIPYTFGWVMAGIGAGSAAIEGFTARIGWRGLPQGMVAIVVIAAMLPRALWPIGYDQRGLRYAGEQIRNANHGAKVVAAHDGRVAYYARARFVMLPEGQMQDLCEWLGNHRVNYLLLSDHDENEGGLYDERGCLKPAGRYPRYRNLYYDLFAVVNPHQPED